MGKIFYIADTHFGHQNIILFDNRPFFSIEEMERELINNWNHVKMVMLFFGVFRRGN